MGIREQVMQEDMRREFRGSDLELLAAILRVEGRGQDGGGALVEARSKPLDMQAGISAGFPFGDEWVCGLRFSGAGLRVYNVMMRHGGEYLVEATGYLDVTITADYDWVVARYSMSGESWTLVRVAGAPGGALPTDPDDETISVPVCQCRLVSGVAGLYRYLATMPAPTMFAPLEV